MSAAAGNRRTDLQRGLVMPFAAGRLIFSRTSLLHRALFPILLTLVVTLVSLWAGYHWGQTWLAHFWMTPTACHNCSWYQWLWSRVSVSAWYLTWMAGTLCLSAVTGLLTSRIATALLMDSLAKGVLDEIGLVAPLGAAVHGAQSPLVQLGRALKRGGVLLAGYAVLGLLSLVPGAAMFTTPAGLLWTVAWLHVDNCCYALQWLGPARVADVRALAVQAPWITAGFLISTCGLQLIPFVGFAATPIMVGGACLYVNAALQDQPNVVSPTVLLPTG